MTQITNFTDIRSIDITEDSVLEYIPNSTIENRREHTSHFRPPNRERLASLQSESNHISSLETNVSTVLRNIDKTSMEVIYRIYQTQHLK